MQRDFFLAEATIGKLGLSWIANDGRITMLRRATDANDLSYGSYYYDPNTTQLFVRLGIGINPNSEHLEITRYRIMSEAWSASPPGMIFVGGLVQLGGWAHANSGCHSWLFDNMDFSYNQEGLYIATVKGELNSCQVHHNGEYGLENATGGRLRIVNSLVYGNQGNGIVHQSLNAIELLHNTIVGNTGYGVSLMSTFQTSENLIANNIIHGNSVDVYVEDENPSGYLLDSRNNYYATSGGEWSSDSSDFISSTPPGFNGDSFELSATSPCRDRGEVIIDSEVLGVWQDARQVIRPQGTMPDIGAFDPDKTSRTFLSGCVESQHGTPWSTRPNEDKWQTTNSTDRNEGRSFAPQLPKPKGSS